MKKIILTLLFIIISPLVSYSEELHDIQNRIDNVGTNILNANKIENRIIFVYSQEEKQNILDMDTMLESGQVIIYKNIYKSIDDDNELAAGLARGIVTASKSFDGIWGGTLTALQIKVSPKKFEIVADKCAVDYMVRAGYNPIALIIYINKTAPQKRHDLLSNKNLASKRLAIIYEYIYTKYPYFLANNEYINNKYYQNFLLTSIYNRKLLEEKIKTGSIKKLKYE